MENFLKRTAEFLIREYNGKFTQLCVVLPNRRGGVFLKEHLRTLSGKTTWAPSIISVEELVEELSGLVCADNITLTLNLFRAWTSLDNHKDESFREFLKWSSTVLHDFNEADRHLVNPDELFRNLREVKHIENWSLSEEPLTEFQLRYLSFMDDLGKLYHVFRKNMQEQGMAWQGLAYRLAAEKPLKNKFTDKYAGFIFCGFNALNVCERKIFSGLKTEGKAEFLWDIDRYYFDDPNQEAGNFLRKNFTDEKLRSSNFISEELLKDEKEIEIVANAGNMGQALIASKKITEWKKENESLQHTAIVLADETNLFPVLSTLPTDINKINVTLEYPLRYTGLFDFYESILQLQVTAEASSKKSISVYYKDFFRIFLNPCFKILCGDERTIREVTDKVKKFNLSFISLSWLEKLFPGVFSQVQFLFEKWDSSFTALENLEKANAIFKKHFFASENLSQADKLQTEYILAFEQAIVRLKDLVRDQGIISDISSLHQLLKEVVADISVPFYGEPLTGLQVMGVLETRTLDFENLVILGMNEGILPSGKSANTFIPYDLKRYFGLPLHAEKDAVYAYHFYRLLQRAKKICLVYNTESDTFGSGEKNRFIAQIEMEMRRKNPNVKISEYIAAGSVTHHENKPISIEKTAGVLELTRIKCGNSNEFSGLSPSSLNLYKDCSLKFWYKYVAGIREEEEVEEDMEAGTFGSILHRTLENLYKPFEGKTLAKADLDFLPEKIETELSNAYKEYYPDENALKGKNLLSVNIIRMYVQRMLNEDKKLIATVQAKGSQLQIISLEKELSAEIKVGSGDEEITVRIFGKMDRMDRVGALFRIVDYKSSVHRDRDNFVFEGFETLFSDKKNNKLIQLFIYAWLAYKNNLAKPAELTPCIIPFKNYSGEPNFILGPNRSAFSFTEETLQSFESVLGDFVKKILSPQEAFIQTDEKKYCEYCGYRIICNR